MLAHHRQHSKQLEHELETLIQNYRFNIEAVFDHESGRDCFRKFLKDNLNIEPFMFYEMVEKYQKTRLDKNRFDMANEIMNSFILVNAKHELNLSVTIRNDILKNWKLIQEFNEHKSAELMECPTDLFQKAQNVIFAELKQDNFPRFTSSEQFKTYLKKEGKKSQYNNSPSALLDQLGTRRAMDRTDSSLSEELSDSISSEDVTAVIESKPSAIVESDRLLIDPHSLYVSPKDYDMVKELISSVNDTNRWKVVDEMTGMKTMTSVNSYYLNPLDGAMPLVCFTGLASGNHKELFNILFSQSFEKEMSSMMKRKLQLDYVKIDRNNNIEYPNSIVYIELDTHFPFAKREMVLTKTIIPDLYNEETDEFDRYVMIQKPTTHQDAPLSKDIIRVSVYGAIIVEKKTKDTLRYYLFDFIDLKGKVPKKLFKGFSRFAAKQVHKFLQKKFLQNKESSKYENDQHTSDGSLELLNDHAKHLREQHLSQKSHQ